MPELRNGSKHAPKRKKKAETNEKFLFFKTEHTQGRQEIIIAVIDQVSIIN